MSIAPPHRMSSLLPASSPRASSATTKSEKSVDFLINEIINAPLIEGTLISSLSLEERQENEVKV